jgi:hypothetical protein
MVAMTWRQLFARRPQWWIDLAARLRRVAGSGSESSLSEERAQFWEEFRAGQREADLRALKSRTILTPCRENGAPK